MQNDVETQATRTDPKAANDRDDIDPAPGQDPEAYPAREVRQGEIIINTPLRRRLFFGGLIGIAILLIIIAGMSIANS